MSDSSPCIGSGLNLTLEGVTFITDDIDGEPRQPSLIGWYIGDNACWPKADKRKELPHQSYLHFRLAA